MISDFYTQSLVLVDESSSTGGYWSTSTDDIYAEAITVPAAINLMSGDERAEYGRIGFDAQYKLFADPSSEIYEGRRCRWSGDTFLIIGVPKNTLQRDHHLLFFLRDVSDA